jgi:hypothetical protein
LTSREIYDIIIIVEKKKGGMIVDIRKTRSSYTFDIFMTDLNDEAIKQIEQIVGKEHNYDTYPLATIYFDIEEDI